MLPQEGRIALALREVYGLTTEEIAHALLVSLDTITRRISHAKERRRTEWIPYEVPSRGELADYHPVHSARAASGSLTIRMSARGSTR